MIAVINESRDASLTRQIGRHNEALPKNMGETMRDVGRAAVSGWGRGGVSAWRSNGEHTHLLRARSATSISRARSFLPSEGTRLRMADAAQLGARHVHARSGRRTRRRTRRQMLAALTANGVQANQEMATACGSPRGRASAGPASPQQSNPGQRTEARRRARWAQRPAHSATASRWAPAPLALRAFGRQESASS